MSGVRSAGGPVQILMTEVQKRFAATFVRRTRITHRLGNAAKSACAYLIAAVPADDEEFDDI